MWLTVVLMGCTSHKLDSTAVDSDPPVVDSAPDSEPFDTGSDAGRPIAGAVTLDDADAALECGVASAPGGLHLTPAAPLTASGLSLVARCGAQADAPAQVFVAPWPVSGAIRLDSAAVFVATGDDGDTSWGHSFTTADLTGDGQPDLAVASSESLEVAVFAGPLSGTGSPETADGSIDLYYYPPYDNGFLGRGGDMDGDGDEELLLGVLGEPSAADHWAYLGEVYVVPGGEAYASLADAARVRGLEGATVGAIQDSAGDLDGDGLDDLVLGPSFSYSGAGSAFVFYSPVTGDRTTAEADAELTTDGGPTAVAGAEDVDGDGTVDLLIGAGYAGDGGEGSAYLVTHLPGGASATADIATAEITGRTQEFVGYSLDGPGDVDGDGYAEVLVGAPGYGHEGGVTYGAALLLYGPLSGTLAAADATAVLSGGSEDEETGYAVGGLGDVNEDGYADVQIGAPYFATSGVRVGTVFLFLGGPGE